MQYETIILELMSRIKALEETVSHITDQLSAKELSEDPTPDISFKNSSSNKRKSRPYSKVTERMVAACYSYGKKAYYNPEIKIADYAKAVASETNMNQRSAHIYIYAVKSMLNGTVFNRSISKTALETFFSMIYSDFGKKGLINAINAAKQYAAYRSASNKPVHSIFAVCNEYQQKIQ